MKRIFIIIIILISNKVFSQDLGVIHTKSLYGFDASGILTQQGYGGRIGYNHFFTDRFFLNVDYNFEMGKVGITNFNYHLVDIQPSFQIWKPFRNVFVNGYIRGSFGIEQANGPEFTVNRSFCYFTGVGLLNEIYLNSKFALLLYGDQNFYGKSNIGNQYWTVGVGLRIMINSF